MLKNKFFYFIIFFFSVFLFFVNPVRAEDSELVETLPSINSLVNSNDQWIIFINNNNLYTLYITDGSFYNTGNYRCGLNNDGSVQRVYDPPTTYLHLHDTTYQKIYRLIDNNWVHIVTYNWAGGYFDYDSSTICATNFDLINYEYALGNSDLVFQNTPIPYTLKGIPFQYNLAMGVMEETLGILPLILVVVVCFLGLRKALALLFKLLRRCLML